eukprot:5972302-Lingulodinium_polyedra.AAC.1
MRLCREIRDRAADEWQNAKLGAPITVDKPNVAWTRVDDGVGHPRPFEGTADDDTDARVTSKRA